METINLDKDINVLCVTAKSFPDQMLISQPDIDPNGYCLEWYLNDMDVRCMVRLDDNKN